ncbi:MAG: hypothetical protein J3R72DRAFT_98175 [Linnemannia gamsii]|nr:MAG: hypothetical protein J3R72DRAFT_98175 [Linnemannia gamsii]
MDSCRQVFGVDNLLTAHESHSSSIGSLLCGVDVLLLWLMQTMICVEGCSIESRCCLFLAFLACNPFCFLYVYPPVAAFRVSLTVVRSMRQ